MTLEVGTKVLGRESSFRVSPGQKAEIVISRNIGPFCLVLKGTDRGGVIESSIPPEDRGIDGMYLLGTFSLEHGQSTEYSFMNGDCVKIVGISEQSRLGV